MPYRQEEIAHIMLRIREMFRISSELEETFPGRKFTLDGHLIGSIGEVLAAYHYGLEYQPPRSGMTPPPRTAAWCRSSPRRGRAMSPCASNSAFPPLHKIILYADHHQGGIDVGRDFSPIVQQWVYYHGRDYVDLPCATLVEDANRFVAQYNMKPISLEEGEELKEALKKAVRDERSALAVADALMPDLFGTESQVKWAQEIRQEAIKTALDLRYKAFHNWSFDKAKRLSKYVTEVLRRKRSAKWFIDNRLDLKEFPSFNGGRRSIRIPKVQKSEAEMDSRAEMMLRPETITHPGIVEILWPQKGGPLLNYEDDYDYFKLILSRHPKEKTSPYVEDLCQFLSILILTKFCRYDWDGSPSGWSGLRSGPAQIIRLQIAELARALLSMGYPVIVTDDEARALVRSEMIHQILN